MSSPLIAVAAAFCQNTGDTLVGPVGAGAFKETFHVVLADGGARALKVYRPGFSRERIVREVTAMQRCSHPNISQLSAVNTFAFGDGEFLLTLEEFLSGGTLGSRLTEDRCLSAEAVRVTGLQLVSAVSHIAANGLVHRDLKPENIMFREDGVTPVIVDFGIVRDLAEVSLTPTYLLQGPGTPYFSAPEQLRNEKSLIDWRTDQFSLGTLLAIAAFGLHPYAEESFTPQQVVERVASREGPSERFNRSADAAGLSVLIKMIAPWPVHRFRTPQDLSEAWN